MSNVTLNVNGATHAVDIDPRDPAALCPCGMILAYGVRGLVADWVSAGLAR